MVFEADIYLIFGWLGLVLATYSFRRLLPREAFLPAFALLNAVFFFTILQFTGRLWSDLLNAAALLGVIFLLHRIALTTERRGHGWGLAILAPVVPLVFLKGFGITQFIGVSYMSFRLSQLAYEASLGKVKVPPFLRYLGFTFFVPTAMLGPINEYSRYEESLTRPMERPFNAQRILRFLYGAMKFFYFAPMGSRLTFENLLPAHSHYGWSELIFSCAAFYVFFYLRFSGFCDMMIALAAMMGVDVKENFDRPILARNIAEYWRRWHISLTDYLREIVFSPVYYCSLRVFGLNQKMAAMGLALLCNFVIIGLWHGIAWNFLLFGIYHAAGVLVMSVYGDFLARRLGGRHVAFTEHPVVRGISWLLTFWFVAFGFLLFDTHDLKGMLGNFRP